MENKQVTEWKKKMCSMYMISKECKQIVYPPNLLEI